MLIDIKSDNHDTYVIDSAVRLPPCNPRRPICTHICWWCKHRGCISYVNFSIDFYAVKNTSNVAMSMIVNIIAIVTTTC